MGRTNEENNRAFNEQTQRRDEARKSYNDSFKASGNRPCFTGATLVLTPNGWQPIADLQKGDQVISYDESDGTTATRYVNKRLNHKLAVIWEIHLEQFEGSICTTKSHSFLTHDGWKKTSQLRSGDFLTSVGGNHALVTSVVKTDHVEPVFNLITEGEHTFVVQGCVVHNFTYFRRLRMWWHKHALPNSVTEEMTVVGAS